MFGLGYPLLEVGINQLAFPGAANGSLVRVKGQVVGSRLIEQRFTGAGWFHGRPSAVHMNPRSSGASNLGPSSAKLARHLAARRARLLARHPHLAGRRLPADMITSSGSGLDPDITPANAYLQAPWVARDRGLPLAVVRRLVARHVRGPWLGLFGQARVDVLSLNLGLRRIAARARHARMAP
jgi:K+-transporting ATPase ATPase C chain